MNRQAVQSSLIRSIGFEDGVMEIEFPNRRVYRYTGPKVEEHFNGLMKAPSVGAYFSANVRRCPDTTCEPVPAEPAEPSPQEPDHHATPIL